MANILTVEPGTERGLRWLLFRWVRRQYSTVPGIFKILGVDMAVAGASGALYDRLHLRKSSPLTRVQREMLATVVNGKVGGAP